MKKLVITFMCVGSSFIAKKAKTRRRDSDNDSRYRKKSVGKSRQVVGVALGRWSAGIINKKPQGISPSIEGLLMSWGALYRVIPTGILSVRSHALAGFRHLAR